MDFHAEMSFPSLAKWFLAGGAFAVLLLGGFLWLVWKGVKKVMSI